MTGNHVVHDDFEKRSPNPLRDPKDRRLPRIPEPCAVVIFGVTGDLARKKLIPAIYDLANRGMLPPSFVVAGFARRDWGDDDFEELAKKAAQQHARTPWRDEVWARLAGNIKFVGGSFDDDNAFDELSVTLDELRDTHRIQGNAAFYLSIPPSAFPVVLKQLARTGMADNTKSGGWRRVVVEKPFGHDLKSAKQLNSLVDEVFTPQDVFRIDHYLGKETVQNMLVFRFGNGIFEPIWNRQFIDHIQITVAETVGVEKRGGYFEQAGTLRDMVPNHICQLMSLTAMEPPNSFHADAVRDEQAKILNAIQPLSGENVLHCSVRGQYGEGEIEGIGVLAYREEPGVAPDSKTETFVALKLHIDNWRWAGVPFYIRTGKRMAARHTEVAIQFKQVPFVLFRETDVSRLAPNFLVMHIAPHEGISLHFSAKMPGMEMRVGGVDMDFNYADYFGSDGSTGYEVLIYDCMIGDQTLFQRADMVEAGWSVVDPILDVWKALPPRNFPNYPAGSWGPKESEEMMERDGRHWRNHLHHAPVVHR
jgi:glucose-6-phosphate 1-dehydrogenase